MNRGVPVAFGLLTRPSALFAAITMDAAAFIRQAGMRPEGGREDYSQVRPHSALGILPPSSMSSAVSENGLATITSDVEPRLDPEPGVT